MKELWVEKYRPMTKKRKVSLREIMEDDYSPMMAQLIKKFEQQYGEELERIMGREVSSKNR
jgi:hypothetical protein